MSSFATDPLHFDLEPSDQVVPPDSDVMFNSHAAGGSGSIAYQWFKNGFTIPGETGPSFTFRVFDRGDEGRFKVRATSGTETIFSREAQLLVRERPAPTITTPTNSATFAEGAAVPFEASVNSPGGVVTNVTFYNGTNVLGSVTASPYRITNSLSIGDYAIMAIAWTEFGISGTSAPITIHVQAALPHIVKSPQDQHVLAGRRVTLTAEASSPTALTYQWTRNNDPIPGANASTYSFVAGDASLSGEYRLVASNEFGSATSDPAIVQIEAAPPAFLSDFWHPDPTRPVDVYQSIAYGNGMLVAGSYNGFMAASADGAKWHDITPASRDTINRIRFTGGKFWSAQNSGTLQSSSDGLNWETHLTGSTRHLMDVAVKDDITIAVGLVGTVARKVANGPWSVTQIDSSHWRGIAAGNGVFVAFEVDSIGYVYAQTSPDGVSWTHNQALTDPTPELYFYQGQFVGVTLGGIFTSTNGQAWTLRLSGNFNTGVVTPTRMMVFGPNGAVARSTDAINWTLDTGTSPGPTSVAYNGSLYFMVGEDNLGSYIAGSLNGLTRAPLNAPLLPQKPLSPTISFAGDRFYLARFYQQGSSGSVAVSTGDEPWNTQLAQPSAAYSSFAYGNGKWVGSVESTSLRRSSDGIHFDTLDAPIPGMINLVFQDGEFLSAGPYLIRSGPDRTWQQSLTSPTFNSVAKGAGVAVAVGENGQIYRSVNFGPFAAVTSGTTAALYGVAYGNGKFVAVGANGTVLSSPDGATWNPGTIDTTKILCQVIFADGIFAAAAQGGTLAYSWDGAIWELAQLNTFKHLTGVAHGNDRWVVVGEGGLLLQTGPRVGGAVSAALSMSASGPVLTINAAAGELLRIDETSSLDIPWTLGPRFITTETPIQRTLSPTNSMRFYRLVR